MAIIIPGGTAEPAAPLELTDLSQSDGRPGRSRSPALRALARMGKAIRSNRKATWGAGLLALFLLVALVTAIFSDGDPNQTGQFKPGLGLSWHHLLGTNGNGEDLFSQVAWGTIPVLEIAFAVGIASTVIAMLIGVGRLPGRHLGQ